jgi:hypothetical protein
MHEMKNLKSWLLVGIAFIVVITGRALIIISPLLSLTVLLIGLGVGILGFYYREDFASNENHLTENQK